MRVMVCGVTVSWALSSAVMSAIDFFDMQSRQAGRSGQARGSKNQPCPPELRLRQIHFRLKLFHEF